MGKESSALKYHGGTIFVDHASSSNFLINQTSLRAGETLQAEIAFERLDQTCGHKIRSFLADKLPFQSNEFKADLIPKGATFGEFDHISSWGCLVCPRFQATRWVETSKVGPEVSSRNVCGSVSFEASSRNVCGSVSRTIEQCWL
jgi:hypothetical protein